MEANTGLPNVDSIPHRKLVYKQLPLNSARKEIRLLRLFPGKGESQPKNIELDGQQYPVTHNLYAALLHLRHRLAASILWIDAICIDQSNILERNHQVGLMKEVYSSASSVQIWLGEEQNNSKLAMKALAAIADPSPDTQMDVHSLTEKSLHAISDVFKRPWWSRIWIIQEFALAKQEPSLRCGYRSLPWSTFSRAAIFLEQLKTGEDAADFFHLLRNSCIVLEQIRTMYQRANEIPLRTLIDLSKDACATDPRDRIYALLGLSRDQERARIVVDYNKTVAEVYQEGVAHSIFANNNLDILSAFPSIGKNPHGLPSWVQDIDNLVPALKGGYWPLIGEFDNPHYSTSEGMPLKARCSDDFNALVIEGLLFDIVVNAEIATSLEAGPGKYPATRYRFAELARTFASSMICQLLQNGGYHKSLYGRGSSCYHSKSGGWGLREVIWRTLIANRSAIGPVKRQETLLYCSDQIPALSIYGRMLEALQKKSTVPDNFFAGQSSMGEETARTLFREPFIKRIMKTLQGRSGFATKNGFIGIGPETMRSGDVVAVLFGGEVPFVLRPQGDHYIFLGDCYVHGIMGGELIDLYKSKGKNMGGPSPSTSCGITKLYD